jgi:hypothetical protein
VGIKPDVEVHITIGDLRKGRDPVLEKALELTSNPYRCRVIADTITPS